MRAVRVGIVDDEPLARRNLELLLQDVDSVGAVDSYGSAAAAIDGLGRQPVEVLLLDVRMPEMDGFGVLEALGADVPPVVIFVTAFEDFALDAFEVHALDYLLKPVDEDRFRTTFRRAVERLDQERGDDLMQRVEHLLAGTSSSDRPGTAARRIPVNDRERIVLLDPQDILWVEAAGNYVILHLQDRSLMQRATMQSWEERLPSSTFRRVHRSAIINLDEVVEMKALEHGEYLLGLSNGDEVRLSRGYRSVADVLLRRDD